MKSKESHLYIVMFSYKRGVELLCDSILIRRANTLSFQTYIFMESVHPLPLVFLSPYPYLRVTTTRFYHDPSQRQSSSKFAISWTIALLGPKRLSQQKPIDPLLLISLRYPQFDLPTF